MTTSASIRSHIGDQLTPLDAIRFSGAGAGLATQAVDAKPDDPRVAMMDHDGVIRIACPDSFGRLRITAAFTHPLGAEAGVFMRVEDVFHGLDRRFEVTRYEAGSDPSEYREPEIELASAAE